MDVIDKSAATDADDSADDFEVIREKEEDLDADLESGSLSKQRNDSGTWAGSQRNSSVTAMADIGNGLDGSSVGALDSSFFGSQINVDASQLESIKELLYTENKKNHVIFEQIAKMIAELATENTSSKDCNCLYKDKIDELSSKLNAAEASCESKDQTIDEFKQELDKMSIEKHLLVQQIDHANEELSNKDEIINVLREELQEQQGVQECSRKLYRERLDKLEELVASYHARGEVNFD